MRNIIFILLVITFPIVNVAAQSMELHFPHFAGQPWKLHLYQGSNKVALVNGSLDENGRSNIRLSEDYSTYRGMMEWVLTNGGGVDAVFSGDEDFSFSSLEENPSAGGTNFINTPENIFLEERYQRQQLLYGKIDALRVTMRAFADDDSLLAILEAEQEKQLQTYTALVEETRTSKLYAARFAEIIDFTRGYGKSLSQDIQKNNEELWHFFVFDMDFEVLYTSGHWQGVLEQWLSLYVHNGDRKNDNLFKDHYSTVLARMKNKNTEAEFRSDIIDLLTKMKREDLVQEVELIKVNLPIGSRAFDFEVGNTKLSMISGEKILFFYGSFCGTCQEELETANRKYKELKQAGITLIGIDTDAGSSKKHNWKYKLTDDGKLFYAYDVVDTPSYVLIDKEGMVLGRFVKLNSLLKYRERNMK